jgi:hypothetical protein
MKIQHVGRVTAVASAALKYSGSERNGTKRLSAPRIRLGFFWKSCVEGHVLDYIT